jgi:ABC-2 type transport system permease protein
MEARRVATVWVSYLITGSALLIGGVVALFVALLAPENTPLPSARAAAALTSGGDALPMSVVGSLMALLAIVSVGHDYRFGLAPVVFTAQPRRGVVMVARLLVLAGTATTLAFGVAVTGAAVCWVLGRAPTQDPTTLRVVAAHVVLAVLWAWFGAGLGWVLRNSAAAVSVLLLGPLLVEPVLSALSRLDESSAAGHAVRWLPFAAARQALGPQVLADVDTIGALAGGLVFTGTVGVVLACGWLLIRWRDA